MKILAVILGLTTTVCASSLPLGASARSRDSRSPRVSGVSHGLRLSLRVKSAAYPIDSLVRTEISVTNVSSHAVSVGNECDFGTVFTQVMASNRHVLYPPPIPGEPVPDCPHLQPVVLPPGSSLTAHPLVILRAHTLRAVGSIERPNGETEVYSPPLRVAFTPGQPTHVKLSGPPSNMRAVFWRAPMAKGKFTYNEWSSCHHADNTSNLSFSGDQWGIRSTAVIHGRFHGCAKGFQWHIVGGWVGHPVVRMDYNSL